MARNIRLAAILATGALALALATSPAVGAPTYSWETGHLYDIITDHMSWFEARDAAGERSILGAQGHLATITSQAEQDFIQNTLPWPEGLGSVWLGGYQPDPTSDPAEGWTWVTGETWDYTNWDSGEPSDSGPEHYLAMPGTFYEEHWGYWNDLPAVYSDGGHPWPGYVVEYPVPEPISAVILCVGSLGLLGRRRGRAG